MNQEFLNTYFKNNWNSDLDKYEFCGWSLIDKVFDEEFVIDVGCGPNPFKGKIKNLVGIDPAYDEADHNVTIEEFTTDDKFDVAFCLGSINFGSFDTIIAQIDRVVNLLKPNARIYWRSNPGQNDHPHQDCNKIDFFPWTFDKHRKFAEMFGFEVTDLKWDNCDRIYAVWERSVNTIPSK